MLVVTKYLLVTMCTPRCDVIFCKTTQISVIFLHFQISKAAKFAASIKRRKDKSVYCSFRGALPLTPWPGILLLDFATSTFGPDTRKIIAPLLFPGFCPHVPPSFRFLAPPMSTCDVYLSSSTILICCGNLGQQVVQRAVQHLDTKRILQICCRPSIWYELVSRYNLCYGFAVDFRSAA